MVGRVFHSLGLLSKGGVIVTERSKLVGRYIGDTENNVQALLEQAKGNVLFIDEAYNLYTEKDNNRDFGNRVIESLLTTLSQKNPDLFVFLDFALTGVYVFSLFHFVSLYSLSLGELCLDNVYSFFLREL